MITTPYNSVLQLAVEMSGRTYPPSVEQAGIFKTFITHHLRQAWEAWAWPEICHVQQEYFAPFIAPGLASPNTTVFDAFDSKYWTMIRDDVLAITVPPDFHPYTSTQWAEAIPNPSAPEYDSITPYAVGDQVSYRGVVYQLHTTAPVGTPPTNNTRWGEVPPFPHFISKTLNADGTPRTVVIGEFLSLTQFDPSLYVYPVPVAWMGLNHKGTVGAMVANQASVWVYFRETPPLTIADTDTIPARFSEIVALNAAASMLRTDGKSDQANEYVAMAMSAMQSELDKVATQEGQRFGVSVASR